jgi:hypothetical protein
VPNYARSIAADDDPGHADRQPGRDPDCAARVEKDRAGKGRVIAARFHEGTGHLDRAGVAGSGSLLGKVGFSPSEYSRHTKPFSRQNVMRSESKNASAVAVLIPPDFVTIRIW